MARTSQQNEGSFLAQHTDHFEESEDGSLVEATRESEFESENWVAYDSSDISDHSFRPALSVIDHNRLSMTENQKSPVTGKTISTPNSERSFRFGDLFNTSNSTPRTPPRPARAVTEDSQSTEKEASPGINAIETNKDTVENEIPKLSPGIPKSTPINNEKVLIDVDTPEGTPPKPVPTVFSTPGPDYLSGKASPLQTSPAALKTEPKPSPSRPSHAMVLRRQSAPASPAYTSSPRSSSFEISPSIAHVLKGGLKRAFNGGQREPTVAQTPRKLAFDTHMSTMLFSKKSSPKKMGRTASVVKSALQDSPSTRPQKYGSYFSTPKGFSTPSSRSSYMSKDEWYDVDEEWSRSGSGFSQQHSANEPDQFQQMMRYQGPPQRFASAIFDPDTPAILGSIAQVSFITIMLGYILYFVHLLVSTVRSDVEKKVEEYSAEIIAEMSMCSKEYIRNNCMPGKRVPALEKMCTAWEKCMNRDPAVVGRAKVSAETFGEILNGFFKHISYKTMIFLTVIIIAILAGTGTITYVASTGRALAKTMKTNKTAVKTPKSTRKRAMYTPRSRRRR
uniref:ARAD1B21868p n=1 Tax=Blastobotrys adeninivorans TaxID=409370 RepID=A0A060TC97_BLAAD